MAENRDLKVLQLSQSNQKGPTFYTSIITLLSLQHNLGPQLLLHLQFLAWNCQNALTALDKVRDSEVP